MKKHIFVIAAIFTMLLVTACGASGSDGAANGREGSDVDVFSLSQGDKVSIVGQVASYNLQNGNTLLVQVLKQGERTIVYHCQMKDEFIDKASEYTMLDVAKVSGKFLNLVDLSTEPDVELPEENIAILVTLYDCELTTD